VLPITVPKLSVVRAAQQTWNVEIDNTLPLVADQALQPTEISVDFRGGTKRIAFGPWALTDLVEAQNLPLGSANGPTSVEVQLSGSKVVVQSSGPLNGELTLTGRDPDGRYGQVTLTD
jgi:hypothetical protein